MAVTSIVTLVGKALEKQSHIYSRDTLISTNTNRPIPSGERPIIKQPVFWCQTCQLKLCTPTHAIQHLTGRSHRSKVNALNPNSEQTLKRKLDNSAPAGGNIVKKAPVQEPESKKTKVQVAADASSDADQKHICNDCSLVFNSASTAEQHFKGKKHASVVTAKLSAAKKINFCQHCNITLNSDGQVKQHYSGVRHKIKAGILKPEQQGRGGVNQRGNPRGRGEVMRGGRGDFSGRGDNSGRARGSFRGGRGTGTRGRGGDASTNNRGRGTYGGQRGWDRGGNRGGNRGSNRGGVTTGGQFGGPPPFNHDSVNMQPIGMRATVPGAKSLLGDYFVNPTTSPDHFQSDQKANFFNNPPDDYFGNQHTDYPPGNAPREQRNGLFEGMRNDYYENEAAMNEWGTSKQQPPKDYFGAPTSGKEYYGANMPPPPKDYFPPQTGGSHKDTYASGSQQNTFGGAPPLSKDIYNSPSQLAQQSGGNGSFNNSFNSNDGYGGNAPFKGEYRMNTDATYDSFYV